VDRLFEHFCPFRQGAGLLPADRLVPKIVSSILPTRCISPLGSAASAGRLLEISSMLAAASREQRLVALMAELVCMAPRAHPLGYFNDNIVETPELGKTMLHRNIVLLAVSLAIAAPAVAQDASAPAPPAGMPSDWTPGSAVTTGTYGQPLLPEGNPALKLVYTAAAVPDAADAAERTAPDSQR
jgi:hypothetical protein